MFPLAHNYLVRRILAMPDYKSIKKTNKLKADLILLGSVTPDLVAGMGMDRNRGHLMGEKLYGFCKENYPEALPFAFGVWSHGADPCGFDYYADEHWQGAKGWCFQKCTPYIPDVIKACNLPEEWGLWKAHNFVEMMAEIECASAMPDLGLGLTEAKANTEAVEIIKTVLCRFDNPIPETVAPVIDSIGEIFAVEQVTPIILGEKYAEQMIRRHDIYGSNPQYIAETVSRISHDLKDEFWQWYEKAEKEIIANLEKNCDYFSFIGQNGL